MGTQEPRQGRGRFKASVRDGFGNQDYSDAGQADADLASAGMALDAVLRSKDLTPGERRDFTAARQWVTKAARAVGRHMDYGDA
jgi:hypothetical protein